MGFEGDGGGVFHKDIVEEAAVLDRGEHGGGGSCYHIAWGSQFLSEYMSRWKITYCGSRKQRDQV